MKKLLLAGVAAAAIGGFAFAPAANADLISIGLQQTGVNGGATTTVASAAASTGISSLVYGTFTFNSVNANDTAASGLPTLLSSTSNNVSSSTAGTITVWITAQDLTQPTGLASVTSSLTSNTLPTGWTVKESTYYDAANGLYSTATPLSAGTFNAIGTDILTSAPVNFASPFSITHEYIITSTGKGTALSTINTSVPEPGSLALLGTALLGLGFVGWTMKKRHAA